MKLLPKQVLKEEFNYYSDKSIDDLRLDMKQLLNKSNTRNISVNLTGKFDSKNEFTITPEWQMLTFKGGGSESYLKGRLIPNGANKTEVIFSIRPHYTITLGFYAFFLFGIIFLVTYHANKDKLDGIIVGLVCTFIVPLIMAALGYSAKKRIKDTFVLTFGLFPFIQ